MPYYCNNRSYNFFSLFWSWLDHKLFKHWDCTIQIWLLMKRKHILPLLKAFPSILPPSSFNSIHVICILYTHTHASTHTLRHTCDSDIFLPFSNLCNRIPHEFRIPNFCRSLIDCKSSPWLRIRKSSTILDFQHLPSFKTHRINVTNGSLINTQVEPLPLGPIFARIEWICTINSSFGGDSLLAFTSNCNNICEPPLVTKKLALRPPPKKKKLFLIV